MKRIVLSSVAALTAVLLSSHAAQAQGTTPYLSSLSQTYTGSAGVGSNSWLAMQLLTGSSPGGYTLNSIQLGMAGASGNPSGFAAMLYSKSDNPGGVLPGSSLGAMTGSASPSSAGVYSYTPTASLTLSPATYYFIVLTSTTAVADGAFNLGLSTYPPTTAIAGWAEGNGVMRSSNGTSGWSPTVPYLGIGQTRYICYRHSRAWRPGSRPPGWIAPDVASPVSIVLALPGEGPDRRLPHELAEHHRDPVGNDQHAGGW